MCTVSYVPQKNGFTLTFNRDEDPSRTAEPPKRMILGNGTVIMAPKDSQGGGTWIAMDDNGRAACLMNGGFSNHIRQSNYRKSRGHLVLAAFEAPSFAKFLSNVDLEAIEPFTLILIASDQIQKLIWNGDKKSIEKMAVDTTHLWSSATLYTIEDHLHKQTYFFRALKDLGTDQEQLLHIHGKESDTPFIIDRPLVKTVSITQLNSKDNHSTLTYMLKERSNEKSNPITFTFNQS